MAATAVHFDTLGAAEDLEAAGIPHNQAKAISLIVDRSRDSGKLAMEMAAMRTDFKEEIAAVRTELKDVHAGLKDEIAAVRTELKDEIAAVRTELKDEIAAVRSDVAVLKDGIAAVRSDVAVLKANIRQLFWISGIQAAALIAILLKLW